MRDATIYLTIKWIAWLRRPELAWSNNLSARVKSSHIGSMRVRCDTNTSCALSKELLNHLLKSLIVGQKLIKLALVQTTTSHYYAATVAATAKFSHLLLELLLHGLKSGVLEQVELSL